MLKKSMLAAAIAGTFLLGPVPAAWARPAPAPVTVDCNYTVSGVWGYTNVTVSGVPNGVRYVAVRGTANLSILNPYEVNAYKVKGLKGTFAGSGSASSGQAGYMLAATSVTIVYNSGTTVNQTLATSATCTAS